MSIVKTHHIYINSENRSSGTISDFIINLKEPIRLMNSNNYFRVKCSKFICPNVINQINSSNNTLQYSITRIGVNQTTNIILSAGNYNILTLLSKLSSKLTASILLYGINIKTNFSYEKSSGKATLILTGLDSIQTSITLYFSNNLRLGSFFGFTSNAVFSYSTTLISFGSISQQHVNVNPINHIYLRSSLPQRESYENIIEPLVYTDIISKIPIMGYTSGQFIFYDNNLSYADLSINIIDSINIYLSDNFSYTLDLNLNYTFSLEIEEIGENKTDYVLDMELRKQNNEDEALLEEIQLLKQLVKQRQLIKKSKKELKN